MNIIDKITVQNWINNEFKDKINDDKWISKQMDQLRIGHEKGDSHITICRHFLAAAVCSAAGISILGEEHN
ncbi:hypothetical protein DRQ50_11750 [bacterium]|nr:MAG: hypothetical protein DRQ50_11750 [bacterium]